MTFIVLLVLGLVVLAGIIAFAGDRLGTYVGRRRLSLFGARPKRTGQIVGVLAGILIMLSTLGVLALAFQNATETLTNFQRTLEELTRLQARERVLLGNVEDANTQLADLRTALADAEQTILTAEEQRDAALEARGAALLERDQLLQQRDELQEAVDDAAQEVERAQSQLQSTQEGLASAVTELAEAEVSLEQARRDRDDAQLDAENALAEAARLQEEASRAEAALLQSNEELADLELQLVQASFDLSEARNQTASAQAQLAQAQTDLSVAEQAQAEAETARQEALDERDAALAEREEALAASQELSQRLVVLNEEVVELENVSEDLRLQAEELGDQNEALRLANESLANENQRLQSQSNSLQSLNDNLEEEIRRRNEDLQSLQAEVDQLRTDVEDQAAQLAELQQEAGRFERGDVYFVRDQLIYSGAVDAATPAEAREELAAFIAEATDYVSRRGVERIRVTTEQFNLLVDVITQTPGSDLIRLISPSNQISSTIDVLVEAIENTRLFERGQLIVSTQFHLGSTQLPISQDEIRTALANIKADAVRKMRRAGLDEGQLPDFGPVTEEMFTNMLLRLTGPVTIGLVATEPIARAGPAHLELMILY